MKMIIDLCSEIVANFGQQAFLYNPHRSLAYTWRNEVKYLSESKFLGFGTESMNFFDNLTDQQAYMQWRPVVDIFIS